MDEGFGGDLVEIWWRFATTDPLEAHRFGCGGLQAALQASPSLAWSCPRYAISDGRFRPSLRGKKTAPLQLTCCRIAGFAECYRCYTAIAAIDAIDLIDGLWGFLGVMTDFFLGSLLWVWDGGEKALWRVWSTGLLDVIWEGWC